MNLCPANNQAVSESTLPERLDRRTSVRTLDNLPEKIAFLSRAIFPPHSVWNQFLTTLSIESKDTSATSAPLGDFHERYHAPRAIGYSGAPAAIS